MGLRRWEFWTLNGAALLALALWLGASWLNTGNRDLQREVNANQALLEQGEQLNRLNAQLAQSLATAASQGDDEIRDLLAANGITFRVRPEPSPATAPGETP